MSKSLFQLGSTKPEVVRSVPPTGAGGGEGETFIEKMWKQSKEIIDWLQLKPRWQFVIGCPNFSAFACLDFGLLP